MIFNGTCESSEGPFTNGTRMMNSEFGVFVASCIREAIRQLPTPALMHLDYGAGIAQVLRALQLDAERIY